MSQPPLRANNPATKFMKIEVFNTTAPTNASQGHDRESTPLVTTNYLCTAHFDPTKYSNPFMQFFLKNRNNIVAVHPGTPPQTALTTPIR